MREPGLIQVYTGNGKGKTTASLGLAFRAIGHGFAVLMIQFMKDNSSYGEAIAAPTLPGLTIISAGRNAFVDVRNPDPVDIQLAREGWEQAKQAITSRDHQLVILDEINLVLAAKLIDTQEVAEFLLANRSCGVELVLTGRYAPPEILDIADYVTEMKEIKHPLQQGVPSRQGIEY